MQTYVVKRGDTLWGLAKKFKIKRDLLYKANPQIKNKDLIYPGQRIKIPVPPVKKRPAPPSKKKPPNKVKPPSKTKPQAPLKPVLGKSGGAGTARVKGVFDNVPFSFNPEEITKNFGNEFNFTDTSNYHYAIPSYKGGRTPTITFDLYVNNQEEAGAVDRMINKLKSHLPAEDLAKHSGRPVSPMIFSFGKHFVKKVYLENYTEVDKKFDMHTLQTTEATLSVSLIVITG